MNDRKQISMNDNLDKQLRPIAYDWNTTGPKLQIWLHKVCWIKIKWETGTSPLKAVYKGSGLHSPKQRTAQIREINE